MEEKNNHNQIPNFKNVIKQRLTTEYWDRTCIDNTKFKCYHVETPLPVFWIFTSNEFARAFQTFDGIVFQYKHEFNVCGSCTILANKHKCKSCSDTKGMNKLPIRDKSILIYVNTLNINKTVINRYIDFFKSIRENYKWDFVLNINEKTISIAVPGLGNWFDKKDNHYFAELQNSLCNFLSQSML